MLNVVSCAVFTCIDATNITTCAETTTETTSNRYTFLKLKIKGQFRHNETLIVPNTLSVGLVPLPTAYFSYTVTEPVLEGK